MSVSLSKSKQEIQEMPLVELTYEILKAQSEPSYFRDLMETIKQLRGLSDDEVAEVIARLYTEINMDGRFVCVGQNVWGLKRWYPVDKVAEKPTSSKRFVRRPSAAKARAAEESESDYDEDDEDDADDDELLPLDAVDADDEDDDEDDERDAGFDDDETEEDVEEEDEEASSDDEDDEDDEEDEDDEDY